MSPGEGAQGVEPGEGAGGQGARGKGVQTQVKDKLQISYTLKDPKSLCTEGVVTAKLQFQIKTIYFEILMGPKFG